MKRTRKWEFVAQEATRLAGIGLAPKEIAERLGLNKSTVTRWMQAGKLVRVARPPVPAKRPEQSPAEWAAAVRESYQLDATDDQLVSLAEQALILSNDLLVSPAVRLAASGRFMALTGRLLVRTRVVDTPAEAPAEPVAPARPRPARVAGDPRALLMAIK